MQQQEVEKTNLDGKQFIDPSLIDPEIWKDAGKEPPTQEIPQAPAQQEEVPNPPETLNEVQEEVVEVNGKAFKKEELDEIISKGLLAKEWEQKVPGNDISKLFPDYTRKSQELAEYKKKMAQLKPVEVQPIEDLGVDREQVDLIQKIVKNLGFVQQQDLVKSSVEAQKDAFLETHPEYLPQNDPNNEKWDRLNAALADYNWQNQPHRVIEFLEKAHRDAAPAWQEPARVNELKQKIAQTKSMNQISSLGGGSQTPPPIKKQVNNAAIEAARKSGWSEQDINELLN